MIPVVSFLPDARSTRAYARTYRNTLAYSRTYQNTSAFHADAFYNAVFLSQLRRFGLGSHEDRQYFATMTGRSNHIMRSLRTMVDRRRRQAYVLMRRVLPVDVARQIIRMMTRPDMYHALFVLPVYGPSNAIID